MARIRWLLLTCFACSACLYSNSPPVTNSRPKLIVLVVFDQLRADYLTRWSDHYGDGGFRRITRGGTSFSNCHYPYVNTVTGSGHATMATGCTPDQHGIVDNEWYDRTSGKMINCSTNDRSVVSPERLLVPAFADALKSATDNRAKVVALSHKDRSACLVGGKHPNACYWFDTTTGTFGTSAYYRDRIHDWVSKVNEQKVGDHLLTQTWNRFRPELNYERLAGPDDVLAERAGIHRTQGRVFPHEFSRNGSQKVEKKFDELLCSPFGNELLLDLVKAAIPAMELGRDEHVDFLSVSFSCNDVVGHSYGPDSQEVFDMTLRSDELLARLLFCLDQGVGNGNYVLALCADHGVCPLPELAAAQHKDAKRVDPSLIRGLAEEFLNQQFGTDDSNAGWIEAFEYPWMYLNQRKIRSRDLKERDVATSLASYLRQQDWASGVYTRAELDRTARNDSSLIGKLRRSYHPDRSGDIGLVLKQYYLCMSKSEGTTHGSPYDYDTHVPLIFYGRGIAAKQFGEEVSPQCIASVFARAAGISMPLPAGATLPKPIVSAPSLE